MTLHMNLHTILTEEHVHMTLHMTLHMKLTEAKVHMTLIMKQTTSAYDADHETNHKCT